MAGILALLGIWLVVTHHYREEEKELRRRLRETVTETFPDEKEKFFQTFGLSRWEGDQRRDREGRADRKTVILVHGLDDPGRVWQDLAPRLVQEGFDVWRMDYPNDQPITASARMFFEALEGLQPHEVRRVAIVSHSMGGLVSRELLTRPDIGYARAASEGRVPDVTTLVMVGTPNHGSQMARFRIFTEIRDQMSRIAQGEGNWLGGVLDGAGEAKIDLLPGSDFLTDLNARPHPAGVRMLVIAGVASPWKERDIHSWVDQLRPNLPEQRQKEFQALGDALVSMTHGLGDGLVTVDSTRLEGVPHRTVDGTHLSMIRNLTEGSRRIPPSVPIIVEHLHSG